MGEVITVGLDIAESVFQVHGVDAAGQVVVQRQLTRAKLIPFFEKLPGRHRGLRHGAPLGPPADRAGSRGEADEPSYVKPYVKRKKNDAADAEGDLRGGDPAQHALRRGKESGAAE